MIVRNFTPYPDAEVEGIVRRAMTASRGALPKVVEVKYRTLRQDTLLGFTPDDHRQPILLRVEPKDRYPQVGASSWQDELRTSALHEIVHFRHAGCHGDHCETEAERYAQRYRRKVKIQTGR